MNRRVAAVVTAAALLLLQWTLVVHAAEHGAPLPDTACELCIAGAHAAPPPSVPAIPGLESPARTTVTTVAPRNRPDPLASAHPARAPPLSA